ncbi:type VI secretion system Vgr family protein [Massilia yuzhufengensis]|uniref:Type VI secretion system secreted protein VgrG n=1 Tax=Massilia yuzhufengensis TaxID=1164594 RepID=A0A1I1FMX5_9BURK|nr:type VI secretion system Vgr family protein [Massilia yuzhufengensis]SFC00342.1 type VI secretion system secreted protein VgrG [Massilia yuzhufengensis]
MLLRALETSLLASLGRFTQDTRLIRLATPLGDALVAECVRGEEAISQAYRFEIDALSTDAHLVLKTLVGRPALVQLLTASGFDCFRPFHGYITGAAMTGANGGFARYVLTIEPWSKFLSLGRDSRTFQDMSVFDILDVIFGSYSGRGLLAPAWRIDVADQGVYAKRSLTTQYQESDLAFAERLMHEEGLFYFFEHSGDPDSAALGSHTMVIADHNGAFQPNAQAEVEFTRPGAVMKADSIDRWRTEMRMNTNAIEMGSWDYRSARQRQASAAGPEGSGPVLASRDAPGLYAWQTREVGQRIAVNQIQAFEAARQVHIAAGTVRTFAPGTSFTLHGHARFDKAGSDDERSFVIVRARHLMHNNLSADMRDGVGKLLGQGVVALAGAHEFGPRETREVDGGRPLYRNRIEAIPARVPYRSTGVDDHGRFLHPHPTVRGQQTAIVVGPAGAVVHTDRDHRVKVQFHWQRGAASHSRATHPTPEGHTGAPGDDSAGTWVRVMTPLAGANWGASMVPRVGQEVLVDFLDGDINRPVVIGSLYNGRGAVDAQHNGVAQGAGAATGNAAPWFPGESGGHAHPAVLSGIRSQAMQGSQSGDGGYNQLVFDDSAGQPRVALQHHAKAHEGTAELNLGHLRHQVDNARLDTVGFGAELKTAHAVALRAGQGMLLSADKRAGGSGSQLDSREAVAQIEESHQLQIDVATLAKKHNAALKGEAEPEELAAIKQMGHSAAVLEGRADQQESGRHEAGGYSEPQLQLSSPAGIVACTPGDAVLAAGTTSSIVAGQDINMVAQGAFSTLVASGISLFTYGKATNKTKPNQEVGIKLHAASGKLSSQSQSGPTSLTADKKITVASVTKTVSISAPKKHVLLTAQGAYIKLEGGNIEVHAPGNVEFKASKKELAGPVSVTGVDLAVKVSELNLKRDLEIEYVDADGNTLADEPITLKFSSGPEKQTVLDGNGKAVLKNAPLGPFGAKQPRRK